MVLKAASKAFLSLRLARALLMLSYQADIIKGKILQKLVIGMGMGNALIRL